MIIDIAWMHSTISCGTGVAMHEFTSLNTYLQKKVNKQVHRNLEFSTTVGTIAHR